MSIVVAERWNSRRWQGGDTPAVELEYIIAEAAKMPVICPAAGRVFNTDGHWS